VPHDVQKVLERLGIEAKRKGRELVAICPNKDHDDSSPSWRIRDEPGSSRHGFHHCWPCGFGGSLASLVEHVLGLEDHAAARDWLGGEAEVDQKEVGGVEVSVRRPRGRFRLPSSVRFAPVERWPSPARDYFVGERGLEAWQVERWGIGYATEGRLKGRIAIVSRDREGRPTRYTARSFTGDGLRYLEPEPEEGANPSAMFGEQHWPPLVERDLVFVIEGAINGLALEAELPGIYLAATAGSEVRGLYGPKLSTWKEVCLMTDPDKAGDRLADDLAASLSRHVSTRRLRLPEGTDQAKLRKDMPGELGRLVRRWLASRGA
jgi:DNA primase